MKCTNNIFCLPPRYVLRIWHRTIHWHSTHYSETRTVSLWASLHKAGSAAWYWLLKVHRSQVRLKVTV